MKRAESSKTDGTTAEQRKNFLRFINDPEGYVKNATESEINSSLDNALEKISNPGAFASYDLLDTINTTFGRDYALVFSGSMPDSVKGKVDLGMRTITLNSKYVNESAPTLAHEYLGHVVTDSLSEPQTDMVFNGIMKSEWWKKHSVAFERTYKELEKGSSEYKSEAIANYIENAVSEGRKGNDVTKTIRNLLNYRGIRGKLVQAFTHTGSKELLKNDRVLNEYISDVRKLTGLAKHERYSLTDREIRELGQVLYKKIKVIEIRPKDISKYFFNGAIYDTAKEKAEPEPNSGSNSTKTFSCAPTGETTRKNS